MLLYTRKHVLLYTSDICKYFALFAPYSLCTLSQTLAPQTLFLRTCSAFGEVAKSWLIKGVDDDTFLSVKSSFDRAVMICPPTHTRADSEEQAKVNECVENIQGGKTSSWAPPLFADNPELVKYFALAVVAACCFIAGEVDRQRVHPRPDTQKNHEVFSAEQVSVRCLLFLLFCMRSRCLLFLSACGIFLTAACFFSCRRFLSACGIFLTAACFFSLSRRWI